MVAKKPAANDKEEAKMIAAAEAAAKKAKNKQDKERMKNATFGIGAVAFCVLAVVLVLGGVATKMGSTSKDAQYVVNRGVMADATAKAEGKFTVASNPFFKWWTVGDVRYGLGGITVSNMVGISGAVQYCPSDDGVEGGALPSSYDARTNWAGCFGDVLDSGNCSASYAIAAADTLAARFCIADNAKYNALRLSPQQVLSCDKKSAGCKGGGVDNVWSYIQRRGLYPEECLPYVGEKGTKCKTECDESKKLKVLDHCILTKEKAIKREIFNRGPVVAPMYLKHEYLVYSSGVYTPTEEADQLYDNDGHAIQHAVSIVGWGKSDDVSYWIVRHSWGTGWGENGYARVSIGSVLRDGYVVVGIPATEAAIQAAEQKKLEEEQAKEEAKKERAARDERIRETRKQVEAEEAAKKDASGDAADVKEADDEAEAEVNLDA